MRLTKYFLPTLISDPKESETISHKLMLKAGLIDKTSSGIYSFLPFGLSCLRKVESIVKEEMERIGAIELLLPTLTPSSLWKETGRWTEYGDDMFRVKDRKGAEFALSPTHEEIICDIVRGRVRSYKKLPLAFYQIQTKFRDEPRPRAGIVRGREFLMKDAYSFHATEECAERAYKKFFEAYCKIFDRCGFSYIIVEAEAGLIGGSFSHEFIALSESGEDTVFLCPKCGYSASPDRCEIGRCEIGIREMADEEDVEPKEVHTPALTSVNDVAKFLKQDPEKLIKTLIYKADEEFVAAIILGTDELAEKKLKKVLGCKELKLAKKEIIGEVTGVPVGFSGPIGLKLRMIADNSIRGRKGLVVGGNKIDTHITGVSCGRDFEPEAFADIKMAKNNDPCPRCEGRLEAKRGIELGHTFKLGTKYSEAMNLVFLDEEGKEHFIIMGCYGIGVSRIVAAIIEQNYDTRGIIWPKALSPFDAILININPQDETLTKLSDELYSILAAEGIKVLYDDRIESPGKKFADADLIGIPWQIIIGKKTNRESIELCERRTKKKEFVSIDRLVDMLK
ncbi:MAG: proline--tRNA ligase [bacterium]